MLTRFEGLAPPRKGVEDERKAQVKRGNCMLLIILLVIT